MRNQEAQKNRERARAYRADAARLERQIESLDRDDPESHDTARIWGQRLDHALRMADECERWADYAEQD